MNRLIHGYRVKPWPLALMLLLALLLAAPAGMATVDSRALPGFGELIREHSAAVVSIRTTREASAEQRMPDMELPEGIPEPFRRFFEGFPGQIPRERRGPAMGQGSGFVISEDGYVLTNAHVVAGADRVTVRFSDRREYPAEVVGSDERSDVAVLKIDADHLPTVTIGDSGRVRVGDWVLAIGSPFGFEHSATHGIVSATGRSLPDGTYVPFIQTDAAVNPGNSGGPLFNLDGEVIGVNSQIYTRTGGYQGLSFAIPINVAMNVAEQLRGKGYVSRGWLGVTIQDLDQTLAESFGLERPAGALVSGVGADSPAAAAGLQAGDIILSYDGRPLERSGELPPLVGETPVGEQVKLEVQRAGERRELMVTIGELEDTDRPARLAEAETEGQRLGVSVAELSAEQRRQLDVEHGLVIREVQPNSPAARAGLQRGDVILSFNHRNVASAEALSELVREAPEGRPAVVLIARDQGRLFLPLELG